MPVTIAPSAVSTVPAARGPEASPVVLREVRLGVGGPVADVVLAAGRIAGIGSGTGVGADLGATAEVVDCAGRTLLPGLWDAHVHIVQWAAARRRVDLTGARSAAEAAGLMEAAAGAAAGRGGSHAGSRTGFRGTAADSAGGSADEPLIGFGFRDALWPDRPDPALLARFAAGPRVVVLVSNDLHTAWINAAGLRALGLPGHPTGVLREEACLDAVARLERATPEVRDRWVADAVRAAAGRGVTGFLDFEYGDNLADWTRRAALAPPAARVAAAVYPAYLDQVIAAGLGTGDVLPGTGGLVTVGPLKLFVDGSLNTRTALCDTPYPGSLDHGVLQTPQEELVRLMARAARHGIRSAVHAIGDRANSLALDAFSRTGAPGRIEHAQLIHRVDLPRFATPGLVLGVQPAHAVDDRDVADRHWAGRTDRAYPYGELLHAGATLEFGSDAPVSPLDPWVGIAAAVHRTGPGGRPGWHPEQAIGLHEALRAATAGRRRTLRLGDPADLVLTDGDPGRVPAEVLREMPVAGTLLAGRWTHRAW